MSLRGESTRIELISTRGKRRQPVGRRAAVERRKKQEFLWLLYAECGADAITVFMSPSLYTSVQTARNPRLRGDEP